MRESTSLSINFFNLIFIVTIFLLPSLSCITDTACCINFEFRWYRSYYALSLNHQKSVEKGNSDRGTEIWQSANSSCICTYDIYEHWCYAVLKPCNKAEKFTVQKLPAPWRNPWSTALSSPLSKNLWIITAVKLQQAIGFSDSCVLCIF